MRVLGRESNDWVGTKHTKGFVNSKSVKRAKTAMLFIIAPLGLIVIVIVNGLRLSEKINVGFLWLSVIAVAAYAIETYELRKSAEKQVALQRDLMMNEFLPIIVPSGEGFIKGGKLELSVVNCGKGVAKDVCVTLNGAVIAKSVTILNDGRPVTLYADQHTEKILTATKSSAKEISLDIGYRDIYEREISTIGVKFKPQGTGANARYILRRNGWQYINPKRSSSRVII